MKYSHKKETHTVTGPVNESKLLTDEEVTAKCRSNILISDEFDDKQLKGCCYEFRVGNISYTYDYEKKITKQYVSDVHIIHPFETLTIVTMEKVALDRRHFLLLFSKGSLFSIGLTPVSTAADPGFAGHLGITMTNLSMRPIQLKKGIPFVKGAFFQLSKEAIHPYVGQHGDATMTWPYPSQFHTEPIDFESIDATHWRFLPLPLRATISRLQDMERYIKWIAVSFIALILLNIIPPFLRDILPQNVIVIVERSVNLIGAFASIVGLFLALALMRKK
jgi:dCTP deaminase